MMSDAEKKEFVTQQMAEFWKTINTTLTAHNAREMHDVTHGSWNSGSALPPSIKEYTRTFMEHLTFLMRVL